MNILKTLFLKKELKQVLAALDLAKSHFESCIFMFETVKQSARQLILNDKNRVIHDITVKKAKPINVAILYIMVAAYDSLVSGDYHFYRGQLRDSGHEIYKIFDIANKQLLSDGYITNDEAEQIGKNLLEAISGSG